MLLQRLICSRKRYCCLSHTLSLSIRWVSLLRQWWCLKPRQPRSRCHQQPSSRLRRSTRKLRPLPWQTEQETRLCWWWCTLWWCSDWTTNPNSPLSVSEDSSTLYSPLRLGSSSDSPVTTSSQTPSPSLTLLTKYQRTRCNLPQRYLQATRKQNIRAFLQRWLCT